MQYQQSWRHQCHCLAQYPSELLFCGARSTNLHLHTRIQVVQQAMLYKLGQTPWQSTVEHKQGSNAQTTGFHWRFHMCCLHADTCTTQGLDCTCYFLPAIACSAFTRKLKAASKKCGLHADTYSCTTQGLDCTCYFLPAIACSAFTRKLKAASKKCSDKTSVLTVVCA